jgi:translation initiation factor 4G
VLQVKLATLGNIRLIGELFKEKMIMERILHACITDLMGKDNKKDVPPEENLEALCNLLMTGAPSPLLGTTPLHHAHR